MKKQVAKVLIVFTILLVIFTPLSITKQVSAQGTCKVSVVEGLSNILKGWYLKKHSTGFRNITVNITLAEDIQLVTVTPDKVEAVFYLNATMLPIIKPEQIEQSPFLRGMQKYLDENGTKLTPGQIKTAKLAIEQKRELMRKMVGKLHEENGIFKVVCNLNISGEIEKGSAKIFLNVSPKGDPEWKDVTELFIPEQPIECKTEEQNGYKEIEGLIKRLYGSEVSINTVSPNGSYRNLYNGYDAATYADHYTSNATKDNQITCWVDNRPETSNYINVAYWNNDQYPLDGPPEYTYYERLACYNCADFVSQSMYYGGMATDSYWNPSVRKAGYNGTWCWVNVGDLTDHMKQRGDWSNTSNIDYDYAHLSFGDVAVRWHYDPKYGVVRDHIVIADYPYYYGTQEAYFSGHTNDVRGYPYPKSSSWYYYSVSCWRYQQ
jgi:hypothetical protein